jgi:hypothetical protein
MGGYQSRITVIWKITLLCVVSAFCNGAINSLVRILNVSLFADTYFIVAMCFTAGLLPGILTAFLFYMPVTYILYYLFTGLWFVSTWNFFLICILAEILLVCFFHAKIKSQEENFLRKPSLNSFTGVAIQLMVLVALDCIVISVLGGTIDFILNKFSVPFPTSFEDTFELGLLRNNVPVLASAILARIPINIVDRFIAVFGGYGVSLVFRKWLGDKTAPLEKKTPMC